jgi:hypothetical protein
MDIVSQIPVVEGGTAGSGVPEATIRIAAERLGTAILRNILVRSWVSGDLEAISGATL